MASLSPNTILLSQQIQRMFINEQARDRLLEEMKAASPEKLQLLAEIIREHDDEALKILNTKMEEKAERKQEFKSQMGVEATAEIGPQQQEDMLKLLEEMFKDPEAIAKFLAVADDLTLSQMEEIFLKAVKQDEKATQEFTTFFHEVRLQKEAFRREYKEGEKQELVKKIQERQALIDEADELLKEVEKTLQKK